MKKKRAEVLPLRSYFHRKVSAVTGSYFATRPPYPDKYIAGLPEDEQEVANFIHNTYMEEPWMGVLRISHYVRMYGYSIGVSYIWTFLSNMGITTTHS